MRVLALPRYGSLAASSRIRCYQYLPSLREAGLHVDVAPLLRDAYVRTLYAGGRPPVFSVAPWYASRFFRVAARRRYDVLWIADELFPGLPATAERLLGRTGPPYVVELDDALFHRYDLHESAIRRRLLSRKIDVVMAHAALVIAGNDYLADRARSAGARRVEILPSAVDVTRYGPARPGNRPFTIGWVGSPTTAKYLGLIAEPLRRQAALGAKLVVLGANRRGLPDLPFEVRTWTEESEAGEIAQFDVGVMPLADGPWERGKCGYKLIQYMASGIPVIASAVGANVSIVQHGVTGFLASSDAEWDEAFRSLAGDPLLRAKMGEAGRRDVERRFATGVTAPRLAALLRDAAGRASGPSSRAAPPA